MSAPDKRKPVVLRPLARLTGRDAVWAVIRELAQQEPGTFTLADIRRRVESGRDLVEDQLRRLVLADIVAQVSPRRGVDAARYRLADDRGFETPRVTASGEIDNIPTDQERLWQAMKVLRVFRAPDLQAATGIGTAATVRTYIKHLHRAGYLVVVEPASPTRQASYRLLPSHNTGPRPPAIRRGKIVFDANLGRQMWPVVEP